MDLSTLEQMIADGKDSPLLRLSLGKLYRKDGQTARAITHLHQAVADKPDYSAAWKELGQALQDAGELDAARDAFEKGLEAAASQGDAQLEKEFGVYLRRVRKAMDNG